MSEKVKNSALFFNVVGYRIMKISACLVIKNEEKLLPRCLESIKGVVDEIIIVHDGPCSDKSLEIARNYKAKIFVLPFVGVAEPLRPFSFQNATGEWILQIDADEYLSQKAQKEIPILVRNKNTDAYSFLWPYPEYDGYIQNGPFSKTIKHCLFRKSKLFMIGIAQEYPRTYGVFQKRSDILLEHKPEYNNFTLQIFRQKWTNWAKLQAKQISDIEKAPVFNISNTSGNAIFRNYLYVRQHPIWTGITETIKFLVIYIMRGILWSGWEGLKIAFLEISYIWLVKKNLELLKYGRKI